MSGTPRKTININDVLRVMNARIYKSDDINVRKELCMMLESFLHSANRYNGFSYVDGWNGTETYRHEYY